MADTPTKVRDRTTAKASASPSASAGSTKPGATESPAADAKEKIKPESTPAADQPPVAPSTSWPYPKERREAERNPAAPATPAPAAAPVRPSFGPAGKHRSLGAVVILSVITLGVYALVWHHRINTEMGDFDPRMHVRPARANAPVVLAWLIGVLVTAAGAARIILAVLNVSLPFDPGFTVAQAYILLAGVLVIPYIELLLPISVVAITMTLERVRIVEDRVGRTTDLQLRPSRSVCWLLMPIIGGLVLQASVQRRLNRVWLLATAPVLAGRINRF